MKLFIALRVEYLKARARVHRFDEEVHLIQEEKRRTLVSLEREALTWDRRESAGRSMPSPEHVQGAAVYAASRAAFHRGLRAKFQTGWNLHESTHSVDIADTDASAVDSRAESQRHETQDEDQGDDDELHFVSTGGDDSDDDAAHGLDDALAESDIE